jgi:phage terminase large subunit-like protein
MKKKSRGQRVIAFIERYCVIPEGSKVGQPVKLEAFQKKFILDVYDNPHGTDTAILSMARKNAKTALIAFIVLAHLVGPEAVKNSRIISGALSRDQAAEVYNLANKCVMQSPVLSNIIRALPSAKKLIGTPLNVEYQAISAEAKTAHGKSPILAIIDEVGQVRGQKSDFIDAITTAQGAYEKPLLIYISTQAPNDADFFSIAIDDAIKNKPKKTICHLYAADDNADLGDAQQADKAQRMPSFEPTFRNLNLNQRVEMSAPFISKGIWILNSQDIDESVFYEEPVYVGIDLSGKVDLTSMVMIAYREKWHVKAHFWTPSKGLHDRAHRDRAPYDQWAKDGHIRTITGASIDYGLVAQEIAEALADSNVAAVAFDRWRIDLLKSELDKIGCQLPLLSYGQGFKDMAPAIDRLEELLLNEHIAHGANPVLTMCMANTRIVMDSAGNRKLDKEKATGRIDGAVALAMAVGAMHQGAEKPNLDHFIFNPITT